MWDSLGYDVLSLISTSLPMVELPNFAQLEKRCNDLSRVRLALVEKLRQKPFNLNWENLVEDERLGNKHGDVMILADALSSGALASLNMLEVNEVNDDQHTVLVTACRRRDIHLWST